MQGPRRWARASGCQSSNLLFLLTSNNHAMLINGTDTGMHVYSHTDTGTHASTNKHTAEASSWKRVQSFVTEEEIILSEWKLLLGERLGRLPKCSSEFKTHECVKFCHSFKLDDTDLVGNDDLILGIGSWQVKLDTSNPNYKQECVPKCSIMSGL